MNAIALKHDIAWSDVVNLLARATSWRVENQFSSVRDFQPGQPADINGLDDVFFKGEDVKNDYDSGFTFMRSRLFHSERLMAGSLKRDSLRLRTGQVFKPGNSEVSKIFESETMTEYVAGGAFYVVDPKTQLIVYVHPNILNIVSNENTVGLWSSQASPPDPEIFSRFGSTEKASKFVSVDELKLLDFVAGVDFANLRSPTHVLG